MEGRALRIRHIVFLEECEMPWENFLFSKEDAESYTFIDKKTNKEVTLRRKRVKR